MVEQADTNEGFWDSLNFLAAYPGLAVEYIEKLIKRELDRGQKLDFQPQK